MANKKNKVKFNICNVHYAPITVADEGKVSFGTPVAMPGAVSISMDPTGEPESFYADGIEYYVINNNQGYDGDLELAMIPETFRIINNILSAITVVNYVPFDSDTIGAPALDLGDVIKFTGGHADETKRSAIFVADEEEAVWVRKIYEMAADGYTPAAIKRYLNENGVKTVGGAEWIDSTVFRLIENEIYKGDYIMHKHFVNEERKLVRNRGEVDAWYIEDDHEAIVSPELWQRAQDALEAKRDYLAEGSVIEEFTEENYPYMNKIYCAKCGYPLYKRIYSKGNRLNWGCGGMKRYGNHLLTRWLRDGYVSCIVGGSAYSSLICG